MELVYNNGISEKSANRNMMPGWEGQSEKYMSGGMEQEDRGAQQKVVYTT